VNSLIRHNRVQRAFSIFATVAILFATTALLLTVGISTASAAPVEQDLTAAEAKEDCELAGGKFVDNSNDVIGDDFICYYDGWTQGCSNGTCGIICLDGGKCANDQQLELPDTTTPPGTPPLGGPVIGAPPVQVAEAPYTTTPPKTPPRGPVIGAPPVQVAEASYTTPPPKTPPRGGDCPIIGGSDPGIC